MGTRTGRQEAPMVVTMEDEVVGVCGAGLHLAVYMVGSDGAVVLLEQNAVMGLDVEYRNWDGLVQDVERRGSSLMRRRGLLGGSPHVFQILVGNGRGVLDGAVVWWRMGGCEGCNSYSSCMRIVRAMGINRLCTYYKSMLYGGYEAGDLDGRLRVLRLVSRLVDARDRYTMMHSERVARYASFLAEVLGLDEGRRRLVDVFGGLHDIGKLSFPDRIFTEEVLDSEGWEIVRTHPVIGAKMVEVLGATWEEKAVVLHHHERYDGVGYPAGLGGEDLPLTVWVVSLADALDTMLSDRVYRKALALDDVLRELRHERGRQFHPLVVDAFFDAVSTGRWEEVYRGYS